MPWSAKAAGLIRTHYQPVAESSRRGLAAATKALRQGAERNGELAEVLARFEAHDEMARAYETAYRRYNWPVNGTVGLKVAPFHLLASEGAEHSGRSHAWHMEMLGRLVARGGMLTPTNWRTVDVADEAEVAAATAEWERSTAAGAEGWVLKPLEGIARAHEGIANRR